MDVGEVSIADWQEGGRVLFLFGRDVAFLLFYLILKKRKCHMTQYEWLCHVT